MNKIKHKLYLIATLILFCAFSAQAQTNTKGTDFWVTFGLNWNLSAKDTALRLQIRIVADQAATGTIKFTESGRIINFSVPAGGVYTYKFTDDDKANSYSTTTTTSAAANKKSVRIQSSAPVSVYALNLCTWLADATNLLPISAIGTDYYHLSRYSEGGPIPKYDQYMVIATQNGTIVYENGVEVITLAEGHVYFKQYDHTANISGYHITSNKPVAYFSAHNFCGISGGGDNFFQQFPPVNAWGKKFLIPVTNRKIELIRIVASQNNTTITKSGGKIMTVAGGKTTLNLNAGEWVELEISLAENGCYIEADKPVQICSYMVGNVYPGTDVTYGGDESLCWIPSVEQSLDSVLMAPFAAGTLNKHFALIVTPTATKYLTTVSIGGAAPTALSGGTWYDNPASGMSFYNVELNKSSSSYLFANNAGLIAYGYGFAHAISYYYMAGSAMHDLSVGFSANNVSHLNLPNTIFSSATVNIKAEIEGTMSTAPGHLKWFIDDVELTAFQDALTWTDQLSPGIYRLKMEVTFSDGTKKIVESKLIIEIISNVEVCIGTPTTFVANTQYAGNDPHYQWQVNGINISGAKNRRFVYAPALGDIISCQIVYEDACLPKDSVSSNKLVIQASGMPSFLAKPEEQVVCAGETVTVNFTGIDINEDLCTWTNSNPNIGLATNGTGVISFVATNTGANSEVAQITVTPASSAGCEDNTLAKTFSITVNPMPAAFTKPDDQTVCDGDLVTLNFTGTGIMASNCVWSNSNPYIGLAASGTGNISFTATNATHHALAATIIATPVSVMGCAAPTLHQTINITVRALPTPFNVSVRDTAICNGTTVNLDHLVTSLGVENVDYKWYETENAPVPILSKIITPNETKQYFVTIEGDNYCETTPANRLAVTVMVEENQTPEFDFDGTLEYCLNAVPFVLPPISNNGIAGTWEPDTISTSVAGESTYIFTPNPGGCVVGTGIVKVIVEVSDIQCKGRFTVHGTVFPFLHNTDTTFNKLFVVTAGLYAVPPEDPGINPIKELLKSKPLQETKAVFYDGTVFVETTPLHPGEIGSVNNPGLPISWEELGYSHGRADYTKVTEQDNHPDKPVGLYTFDNVEEGEYILALSAPGFVTRYAKIHIGSDDPLGHRELIPGDMNNDGQIDQRDVTLISAMQSSFPSARYNIKFDINRDKVIDIEDVQIILDTYYGFIVPFYNETWDWLMNY